ncbi:hypothetical protein C2G38_2210197 [Gigaspora rosea]|uniref:Uncharacterized protein n=1 Tax=Gigaspora rosea TaxID=44941 RepID=A0A397UIL8_9GLOM|nr:hypothetical protein C2G38_2210197 [Gigaspora rosea]
MPLFADVPTIAGNQVLSPTTYQKKILYNAIQKFWGVQIHDESDAAKMLSYLIEQRNKDPDYVVITRLEGPHNELTGLFWMTSQQRNELWAKFHDVIIQDNTAKTNQYEMALSIFVGIDNNFKTRVLAQALTKYKTLVDYSWILQCILEATESLSPILDQGTLLKDLVKVIESELDKKSYYNRIKDYYGSNVAIGLSTTYNTIFKDIDDVLKDYLVPIPLSMQRAQMNQALLYQGMLVTIDQVNESNSNHEIIEHMYDVPQIRLQNLLSDINTVFHSGLIHTRWFELAPPETLCYITIAQGTKSYTTQGLHFINEIRTSNVYTPSIWKKVNKRIEFGSTMSVAKTSVQIAIEEGVTSELTGLLT